MKILLISNFFWPENVAAAFRAFENGKNWAKENDVTIFTGNPNYPLGRLYKGYSNKLIEIENYEKMRILRSKILVLPNKNFIYQGLNSLGFLFFGFLNLLVNLKKIGKNDVVIGTSGQILTPLLALVYSRLKNIPFVLELRDISFIQMLALGKSEKTLPYKLLKWLELYLCKKASLVVVVTNGFKEELITYHVPKNKIVVIPNGVEINEEDIDEKKVINLENSKIKISFFGNFGKSQNIIETLKLLEEFYDDIEILLIGAGKEREKILEFIQKNKKIKIELLHSMPQSDLENYYKTTDICLVTLSNNKLFKNTIPSKIFQNAKRKKANLYIGPESEGSHIIEKGDMGYVVLLDNEIEVKNKLKKIFEEIKLNKNILKIKGENGYKFIIKNYNREILAKKYMEYLKEVKNGDI